jgi:GNAT superfamily N-acetyltransferase
MIADIFGKAMASYQTRNREHEVMNLDIVREGTVAPAEIEALRIAVGWDKGSGNYDKILQRHFTYYTVRASDGHLIGYMSILSDGLADAFLLDLMVHPDFQGQGVGRRIVQRAIRDMKDAGIQCVQVTFDEKLRDFYRKCGFFIFGGGVVDFKHIA